MQLGELACDQLIAEPLTNITRRNQRACAVHAAGQEKNTGVTTPCCNHSGDGRTHFS
jgi:hypothetical protein